MTSSTQLDNVSDLVQQFACDLEALPSSSRITAEDAEVIYALAVDAVNINDFEKASRFLSFLTIYKPTNPVYLYSSGFCLRMIGRYDEALLKFSLAASLNPEEPAHTLGIVDCLLMKREYVDALETLDKVIQFCKLANSDTTQTPSMNHQNSNGCLLGDVKKVLLKAEALKNLLHLGADAA